MARTQFLSEADHDAVSQAVAAAEATTDGEIVTIVARRSDSYHDVGLHWAVATIFLALAIYAGFPDFYRQLILDISGSWETTVSDRLFLYTILCALIVKFLVVRYALAWMPLRMAMTPAATKARRVRRRAIDLFRAAAERRTRAATGILIYLSLDEHRAEIVADSSITAKVDDAVWGEAMVALIDHVRAGRPGQGLAAAVQQVGVVLAAHFPRSAGDTNELPDRLIEL